MSAWTEFYVDRAQQQVNCCAAHPTLFVCAVYSSITASPSLPPNTLGAKYVIRKRAPGSDEAAKQKGTVPTFQ